MKEMTLTDFFKGNETHRGEYIVLYKKGDFYEAYGKDAERLAYCTGVTLTRPKDGSRAWAGFPWRQLMTGRNDYGRYLSKMLHSFFVVLVDDSGIVTDYYTTKLDEGYELSFDGNIEFHAGPIVATYPYSLYCNGIRVHKENGGREIWAFVMCDKSNRGAYFMYVNSEQCMTGDNALSYAFGMSGAEYHYHKNHFLLVFVLLNNGQYFFAHSLNRPADVPRIDDLARNFRIDPDDNTSLIHTEEGYGDYVDAQLYKM